MSLSPDMPPLFTRNSSIPPLKSNAHKNHTLIEKKVKRSVSDSDFSSDESLVTNPHSLKDYQIEEIDDDLPGSFKPNETMKGKAQLKASHEKRVDDPRLEAYKTEVEGRFNIGLKTWLNDRSVKGNKLKAIELMTKAFEKNETTLSLDDLGLTSIPPEIKHLKALRDLNLSCNKLSSLPPELGELTQLNEIDLSANQFTIFPPEIFELRSLTYLRCELNRLRAIPPEIGRLTSLKEIWLSGNKLTSLPPEIGHLTHLKTLILHKNRLAALPEEIGQLKKLETLFLNDNKLSFLPSEIGKLSSLEFLDVVGNLLTTVPSTIGNLDKLTRLDLAQNKITSLPDDLGDLASVEVIKLNQNSKLSKLPNSLTKCKNLGILQCDKTSVDRKIITTILETCKTQRQ